MLPKNLIPKVKKAIYNEKAYAKAKEENKLFCKDCGCLYFKHYWATHIESNKHKTNVEKDKVDFITEVQKLAKELVKEVSKSTALKLYELIKHEYYDASGEEVEEMIEYNKPNPITEAERIFCDQEVGCMNMEVIEKISNFANEGYHPTYLERLEKRHEMIDASSPEAKIKLLDFYRKCETFIEDTEKEIEKDRLKQEKERDEWFKKLEKEDKEAKEARLEERQPNRKIIKEISSHIIIPQTIEEDMDYTVNSNDEDCNSEDSYDVEARFYKEAEEIYRIYNSKKRIELLQQELEGCDDFIDYEKFINELAPSKSPTGKIINKILDLEDIKRIYCGIKTYKYDLEKYN